MKNDTTKLKIEIEKLYPQKLTEEELSDSVQNLLDFFSLLREIDQEIKGKNHEDK